ncbi:transporter substrate-binding domain-containing protein [Paenirhodobacter enshiensis]|uniref:Amino acid ABC transporter substrate-binding protein n=1 Tax=Paenirhodobacter enshiensis TaxID=1105367 RepID=A0A086XV47_9RHOB|nr:transporter substrate-binding domain-containing protein [Paenirhodobacter enshiensis]KFI25897.1 amino acid ABC transporter substrate-binding protein [Paenirhodobacter enshiensis]
MLNRRSFVATVTAATLLAATAARAEDALANIEKTKTIRIAVPTDYPPYGFAGLDLQPQGLDIDMAKLIADKMGAKLEMVPVTSANRIPYLQTAQVDLVISTLGKNAEREKVIDFSHAYAPFFQAVYGPKSMEIKDFAALDGKTIAVAKGAMEETELAKLGPAGMVFSRYEDQATATAAFVAGQTQLIATSTSNAALMAQKNPQLDAEMKLIIKESPCFVGINKGQDALLGKVNEIILAAKADGTLDKLSMKWLKKPAGDLPL